MQQGLAAAADVRPTRHCNHCRAVLHPFIHSLKMLGEGVGQLPVKSQVPLLQVAMRLTSKLPSLHIAKQLRPDKVGRSGQDQESTLAAASLLGWVVQAADMRQRSCASKGTR